METCRIKICGMTNSRDALRAAELGADYVGFIFAAESPRSVTFETVMDVTSRLPADLQKVGVFVNNDAQYIHHVMRTCRLDIAQLHGDEKAGVAQAVGTDIVWKTFHLRNKDDLPAAEQFPADKILVDARTAEARGGTGKTADWNLVAEIARKRDTILAGGITPENVQEAIHQVQPFAVDVGSGVESKPGRKDHARMAALVQAVRVR